MRQGTRVAVVVLVGALSGATLGCTSKEVASDDHKTALRELTNVAAGLEIEAEPSSGVRSDYATCLYTGVEELEAKYDANVPPLADMLTDYWQKNEPVEAGSLREALVGGGATPEEVDDLFANCGPAPADESEPPASSSSTAPSPTTGIVDTASTLLALVQASTDGMVPPDKQVCYRDALLAELPYGIDTVLEVPATIGPETLQEILATFDISVQKQGELLGVCMSS